MLDGLHLQSTLKQPGFANFSTGEIGWVSKQQNCPIATFDQENLHQILALHFRISENVLPKRAEEMKLEELRRARKVREDFAAAERAEGERKAAGAAAMREVAEHARLVLSIEMGLISHFMHSISKSATVCIGLFLKEKLTRA